MEMKTFLFDLDGTIADTDASTKDALRNLHKKLGCRQVTDEDIALLRREGWNAFLVQLGLGKEGITGVTEALRARWSEEMDRIPVVAGMRETLTTLHDKGNRLGIITSNSRENVDRFLHAQRLELFDFLNAGNAVLGKAQSIIDLLDREHLDRSLTFYVGDEQRDIDAARAAGIAVVSVTWGFGEREALLTLKPDYCIDSPRELLEIAK
jgi:phosphoglycolate phosphatase